MGSGSKRLSLRRSIVGSIKRSLSPLSRTSDSPTTSQISSGSVELAQDNLFLNKGQLLPTRASSTSSRFKKSDSLSINSRFVTESTDDSSSQNDELSLSHVPSKTSRILKSTSFSPENRASVQSMQDIPSPKKTLPTRAASTASRLGKSISASFYTDNKHSIQALEDLPAHVDYQFLPTQTISSASSRFSKKLRPKSITPNNRSSIQSIQELPSPGKDVSLPARASSTSGRYSSGARLASTINQITSKSERSTPPTKRSSIVSFQIPEGAQVNSLQNDVLLTIQPPSNSNTSNHSSWLSGSRTSSTKSRKSSQVAALQRLTLGAGRETSLSQRQYDATTVKETTLPWDPPFNRTWDLMAHDGMPSDSNELFEHSLPPRLDHNSSPLFNLQIKIRRKIYSYCLPNRKDITVCLSPYFATKNCYHGYYFTSPWDILEPVAGGLASFSLMRNDLMTYFWTEYQFHVTLTPFCNSVFTPLSSVWLPKFLDRIQHLTIEVDLTRFGGNALKFARQFGYNMEKMENLLHPVVDGLMDRRGKMAQLVVLCRRFNGNRRVDENDPTWKADDIFEYCPKEAIQFCDAIINLRGTVKSVRMAGFPLDYTKTLLKAMFSQAEDFHHYIIPNQSAWPPLPQLYPGPRHAPNLYAASMAPMSPELPNYRESLNTQWQDEQSIDSSERPEDNGDSPMRPETSLSVTTVGDHVKLYQDLLPPINSPRPSADPVELVPDSNATPTMVATVTHEVMAAEDRNNLKRHPKKPNPRNSRDFTPGHFYCQPKCEGEAECVSQEGQRTSNPAMKNMIQQATNNKWSSQKANRCEDPLSTASSRQTIPKEKEKPLPKTPNPLSKRKSQFNERQMPDIPESPRNLTRDDPHSPTPAIRPGTLKATSNIHVNRIRSHIEKATAESFESSSMHSLLPTPPQASEPEVFESDNDRSLVHTPSREFKSGVSKSRNETRPSRPSRTSRPSRPSQSASTENIRELALERSIDRSLLRTPSPPAGPKTVAKTSPNTLNNINEQDPKYLRSIRALQSASTSTESIIRIPPQIHRPASLAHSTIDSVMSSPMISPMIAPQRIFSSTGAQTVRSETGQSAGSAKSISKRWNPFSRRSG
ncbi:hypothetical protein NHQ30_009250 [Ciborinia camelliae]|nr:hypothetical protein NHQ30_009250 [Ciborinia camelliae]